MSGPSTSGTRITVPEHLTQDRVERVAREFTLVYHDLKEQTFATTTWLRVPLVKTAADMLVFQQIIAETRPELIVETGVYVGGSALMFASMQELLGIDGRVIAVDVDLSAVNERVREHPRIELIEASSTDPEIVDRIATEARGKRVMVDLDSDHRAHHVLAELRAYSPLVSPGCYLVVEDGFLGGRPVRPDAVPGPSEALDAWLAEDPPFEPDRWRERFLITQNPRGYLRSTREEPGSPPRRERPDNFLIGSLELSGAAAGARPEGGEAEAPAAEERPEEPAESLERAAGEPDREVDALRRRVRGIVREADGSERDPHAGLSVENLLREIEIQRELLRERNRLIARDRAHLRRITQSFPYRAYRSLRRLPGARWLAARRDRRTMARAKAQRAQRARTRRERGERFSDQHRGQ